MRFTIYSLFPALLTPYLGEALLARAVHLGLVEVEVRDLRRFAGNRTGRVDDTPYGGGAGMVMRVDVAGQAVAELAQDDPPPDETILLSPAGEPLTQPLVQELAAMKHVALIAGRYEGFDARTEKLVTREVSIGDYVLMGGELPALVVLEAVARLQPGVLAGILLARPLRRRLDPHHVRPLLLALCSLAALIILVRGVLNSGFI